MDPNKTYDPFGPGMSAGAFPDADRRPRRRKRSLRRIVRGGALCLCAALILAGAGMGGAALYDALAGRRRTLAGETLVFPQLQADRENALSLPEVYERARPWVVTITCRFGDAVGYGTGFSLAEGGYLATCAHVIDHGSGTVTVTDWLGRSWPAEVLALDRQTDVAVLVCEGLELEPAALGISTQVVVGETAAVIGNPVSRSFAGSMTSGIISTKIYELTTDTIKVELENGDIYKLERETWDNIQYTYDEKEKKVVENVLGSFSQFPIKPAWALTVHKSQGLTFSKVAIDFGGGAFTSGQTYVALSRCTKLEGITLLKPLSARDIIISYAVTAFSRSFNNQHIIDQALQQEKALSLYRKAGHAFDHYEFSECVKCFTEAMTVIDVSKKTSVHRLIAKKLYRFNALNKQIKQLEDVIDSQNQLLRQLAEEYTEMGKQSLGIGDLVNEDEVPYGQMKKFDEITFKSANANFDKAIRICPTFTPAYIGKAHLLYSIGEAEEAETLYKKALDTDPQSFEVHMALGRLYTELKNVPEAIKSYKRAIRTDKKAPQPYEALAAIFKKMDLDDRAEEFEEKAQRLRKAQMKKNRKKPRK